MKCPGDWEGEHSPGGLAGALRSREQVVLTAASSTEPLYAGHAVSLSKLSCPTFHMVNQKLMNTELPRVQSMSSEQETRPALHVFSCTYFGTKKSYQRSSMTM